MIALAGPKYYNNETFLNCGHGLVVEHVLAKDETGVRFSLAALKECPLFYPRNIRILWKTGDNSVSNVYKGHMERLSLSGVFRENSLLNKDILVKDIKI